MATIVTTVNIPYIDFMEMKKDADDKKAVIELLKAKFPADDCQLMAIKSVLGIVEEEEEPTDPVDPSDPSDPSGTTDPTDPSGTTDPIDPAP